MLSTHLSDRSGGEVIAGLRGGDISVLISQSDLNYSRKLVDVEYVIERGANVDAAAQAV